jgi:dihydrolipoamide dehydrogenase
MPEQSFDVVVIGGGPGGYTAAIRASQLKLSVALIEREHLGGICLNWGCIPTKALLKNAEVVQSMKKAEEWGIHAGEVSVDFPKVIKRSRGVAERMSKGVEFLMKKNKVAVISGFGRLLGAGKIEVKQTDGATNVVTGKHIILATGARPRPLPGLPFDRKRILTSAEAMNLPSQPSSMVIIGAGAIGVEFAYFYNAIGTKVTLIEMMPSVLPIEDREVTKELERNLRKQGMEVLTGTKVDSVKPGADNVLVRATTPDGQKDITADVALVAIGVQGNVENLGLEETGVMLEKGYVKVDDDYRTSVPGVYAIGDVAGPPWLAHVASAEGIHCVEAIAGHHPEPIDYTSIPGCTYCHPQVASIGMTEEKAKAEGHEVKIGKFPNRALGKAVAVGEPDGFVKLVFDAKYNELLGAHIIGAEATELIMELLIAKRHEATSTSILRSIHAHPTMSEAIMEAAAAAEGEAINI